MDYEDRDEGELLRVRLGAGQTSRERDRDGEKKGRREEPHGDASANRPQEAVLREDGSGARLRERKDDAAAAGDEQSEKGRVHG